jgi:hypothetical protein
MAHDGRDRGREDGWRGRQDDRDGDWGRETQWRGDQGFGGGWGNQVPRPQRLGDRGRGPADDPRGEGERYRRDEGGGYGGGGGRYGPAGAQGEFGGGGIGLDSEFSGGPRFDRADVGSTGTHGVHPVSSPSSPGYGGGGMFGSSAREFAIVQQDPHYAEWRSRQMEELDRDYHEYRSENQSRFDREFGQWRERRGEQRKAVGRAMEHMEVVGSDGSHVGTVDKIRGDRIILTKSDADAGGIHHSIPCGWIDSVEDKVKLNIDAEEARRRWQSEGRSRALFEREDSGQAGPHVLNRSFAGTYRDKKED